MDGVAAIRFTGDHSSDDDGEPALVPRWGHRYASHAWPKDWQLS